MRRTAWPAAVVASCIVVLGGICVFIAGYSLGGVAATDAAAATPSPSPAPLTPPAAAGYLCTLPAAYDGVAYARTWIQLGDTFAAGAGASVPAESSWIALLRGYARTRLGNSPTIINAVGTAAGDLPEQIRLLRALPAWQQLLARRERALIFVSYGVEWLQAVPDAALSTVIAHLALLQGTTNASLIAPDVASQFSVVLVTHPDPTAGGIYVPPEYARCTIPALNEPTLASRATHTQIYANMHAHLHALAARNGWAVVDADAALAPHAWPSAHASDGCAWRDCDTLNDRGHSMLATLLWACLQRTPYVAP